MAKKVTEVKEAEEHNEIVDAIRKILLAGIGGVALAQDEISKFLNKMVDRGEIAEKDARKLLEEVTSRRKEQTKKAEEEIDRRLEDMLARMNVPTKADIDTLGEKIAKLTDKIEQLKKNGSS
jgi:poly(hydroxyalkanoate) granule-associated protein